MTTTKTPQAAQGLAEHVNEALRANDTKGRGVVLPWFMWKNVSRFAARAIGGNHLTSCVERAGGPTLEQQMATEDARLRADGYLLTEDVVREAVASWIGWSDLASASRSIRSREVPTSLPAVVAFAEYAESLLLIALAMQRPNVSVCKAFTLAIEHQVGDLPSGVHLAAVEAIEAVAEVTGLTAREALPTLERAVTDIRLRLQRKSALGVDA